MKLIKIDKEAQNAKPTGLGLLLLGKSPEDHFPQARIKLTIRKEDNDTIIKDFNGALILLPQAIEEYFEAVFPKGFSSRKSFSRNENVEASASAIYEVVMNAIIHRDYSIDGARIMIDINDESVVVSSPGKPICTLEQLNNFTAPSFSRNPKIAHIFFEMGFVEERGFGMEELSKFQNYGLPKPIYVLENNTLITTLYREIDSNKQTIVKEELPGIGLLRKHKQLTTKQYAELSGIKERQARNHLKALLDNEKAIKDGNDYIWKE
jgi:ATP-dependent DNA helicase RecG